VAPGTDLARLAAEQDVDILLDAPQGLLEDARLLSLLDDAPCDVAVVLGDHFDIKGPVLVPFSGFEHDWAAVELGAWFAQALECPIQLAGPSTGPGGRDASRLLASASLVLQKALGVQADPLIVEPTPAALVAAARDSGLVVVGLTERWRREGLGGARTALATTPGLTTLLVRRGLRPGGSPHRPARPASPGRSGRAASAPRRRSRLSARLASGAGGGSIGEETPECLLDPWHDPHEVERPPASPGTDSLQVGVADGLAVPVEVHRARGDVEAHSRELLAQPLTTIRQVAIRGLEPAQQALHGVVEGQHDGVSASEGGSPGNAFENAVR
jgi:hypothetical protein